jgi:hypothetical protein
MHSVRLQEALAEFVGDAAAALHDAVLAGAEVPFELESQTGRRRSGPALYCYRPLTSEFIAEREATLERLPSHAEAVRVLSGFDGLDRYLVGAGVDPGRASGRMRVRGAIRALLRDVFAEQSDFELRPERLRAALERLEQSAHASASGVTLAATLHGLTIASAEVPLTAGLTIAHPDALEGLPEAALPAAEDQAAGHLIAVLSCEEADPRMAIAHGREVLKDLLRALRLFGDGRVTLGALAWARIGTASWNALALGSGGRPHGMLFVGAEQEDELRAFCNLVSRRAPAGNPLAWALRRFELGCGREHPYEGLSDHLLALRALLEPEGPHSGMLPGRLAALCATPEQRLALTERTVAALELEQAVIAGTAVEHAAGAELANDMANHLRALLRDVICGHLDPDLEALADEILLEPQELADDAGEAQPMGLDSIEDVFGHASESQEVLDLSV